MDGELHLGFPTPSDRGIFLEPTCWTLPPYGHCMTVQGHGDFLVLREVSRGEHSCSFQHGPQVGGHLDFMSPLPWITKALQGGILPLEDAGTEDDGISVPEMDPSPRKPIFFRSVSNEYFGDRGGK